MPSVPSSASLQEIDQGAIVIIDPYTSGRFLVDELCQRGHALVAVRSIPPASLRGNLLDTWNPVPFQHIVRYEGDVAQLVAELRAKTKSQVRAVVAGCELGVRLADELALALGLRGNDASNPRCRWNKFEMHERLRVCGLSSCLQRCCESEDQALEFFHEVLKCKPCVVKPCASYGGVDVYRVDDDVALVEAFKKVRSATDLFGNLSKVVLLQELLVGQEYFVDCVSLDSKHLVVATWSSLPYDRTTTLAYDSDEDSVQRSLHSYVFQCLSALGLQNGASSSKVIHRDTGPCLIETGCRLNGSVGPALWSRCVGREQTQAYLVADVLVEDGKQLSKQLRAVALGSPAYELQEFAMQVVLQCHERGRLTDSIEESSGKWIRSLRTFWLLKFFVEDGHKIEPTVDLHSSLGFVILVGSSVLELERDATAIRDRERSGQMYILRRDDDGGSISETFHRIASLGGSAAWSRELDIQGGKLLSPQVSRAPSPVLSPVRAPMLPPDFGGLVEFSLDGADGLDGDLDDGFTL